MVGYFYFLTLLTLKKKLLLLKDPISIFCRHLSNTNNEYLLNIWKNRVKITPKELRYQANMIILEEKINHRPDLAKKYLKKWVSYSDNEGDNNINLLKDSEIRIIDKNKSIILKCGDEYVGAVIRDAAIKELFNHFGVKIKSIVEGHPILK